MRRLTAKKSLLQGKLGKVYNMVGCSLIIELYSMQWEHACTQILRIDHTDAKGLYLQGKNELVLFCSSKFVSFAALFGARDHNSYQHLSNFNLLGFQPL